jgi:hypothetical protein
MSKTTMSLSVQMFNDKIRAMNQTQSRDVVLTAQEARNLHSDIFALLAKIAELENNKTTNSTTTPNGTSLDFDGGRF